ncbi:hypothetical protein, partial [Elizabethkingia meningoseptica]
MKYINFYSCCHISKGYINSCIFDLERSIFFTIPSYYYDYFSGEVNIEYSLLDPFYKDDTDLHELIVFLFENKFIYYSNIEIKSKENLEFITPFK